MEKKKHIAPQWFWKSLFSEISVSLLQPGLVLQSVLICCCWNNTRREDYHVYFPTQNKNLLLFCSHFVSSICFTYWPFIRSRLESSEYKTVLSYIADLHITPQISYLLCIWQKCQIAAETSSSFQLNMTGCWFHTDTPSALININVALALLLLAQGRHCRCPGHQSCSRKPTRAAHTHTVPACSPCVPASLAAPQMEQEVPPRAIIRLHPCSHAPTAPEGHRGTWRCQQSPFLPHQTGIYGAELSTDRQRTGSLSTTYWTLPTLPIYWHN